MSLATEVKSEIAACFSDGGAPLRLADRLDAMVDELQQRFAEGEFTREQLCGLVAYTGRVTAWGLRDGHVPELGESNPTMSLASFLAGDIGVYPNWDLPAMEFPGTSERWSDEV